MPEKQRRKLPTVSGRAHGFPPPLHPKPMSTQFLFLIVMIKLCFPRLYSVVKFLNVRAHFWPLLMVSEERIDYRIKIRVPATTILGEAA